MSEINTPQEIPATADAITSPPDAPQKAPRVKKPVVLPAKIQKKLDSLNSKIEKLSTDNKSLKSQLAHAKTSHTRIRRIPKPVAVPEAPVEDA